MADQGERRERVGVSRRAPQVRRDEILAATVAVIEARRLAGVRVADVAGAVGVSTALVFYHFDSKERLVAEAFDFAAQRDLARLAGVTSDRDDPRRRLSVALELYAPAARDSSFPLWIEAWSAALVEPEIRAAWVRLDRQWKAAFAQIIDDGVAANVFSCADAEAAAWRIVAMLDGLAVQAVANPTAPSRETLLAWARGLACAELGLPTDSLDAASPDPG